LLSGLVLAGANHREAAGSEEDDGILTAEEIATLDLSGVDLVALSACGTGAGVVMSGEGVFGLRRAFRLAGAKKLITSLWAVEDEATRKWMKAFYEALFRKGLQTAASVREASLEILHELRKKRKSTHPFYWAGFVASGDWR
jgi:CHAT domain-containing protein